jgi:hypothetical protein
MINVARAHHNMYSESQQRTALLTTQVLYAYISLVNGKLFVASISVITASNGK